MPLAVCATPIGNLDDVTLRALEELRAADVVLCEDTRHTRVLLDRHDIQVNDPAICAEGSFNVPGAENVRALRASLNVLGDGFIEAIDSNTLLNIANAQPGQSGGQIAGTFIQVPVSEAPGQVRAGRFGWKNQQASLLSFSADAYVNEQGVTSRLQPTESTTLCDTVADPEDHNDAAGLADIDHFARFMRATQAPPIDATLAATADAITGSNLFNQIGCSICHVTSITTAPAGPVINDNDAVFHGCVAGL